MHTDKYLQINGFSGPLQGKKEEGMPLSLSTALAGFLEEWEPSDGNTVQKLQGNCPGPSRHGLSDKPEIPYTLDFLTGFLKDFISVISPGGFTFAGHSLGGAICLNLVIKYPSLVKKLMVLNSVFIKIPFSLRFFRRGFFQKINILYRLQHREAHYQAKLLQQQREAETGLTMHTVISTSQEL